jgi:Putative porin
MIKKHHMTKVAILAGAAVLLAGSGPLAAQTADDALLNKLVQKGILTQQEADELRKESDQDFKKAFRSEANTPSWIKNVKFSGDFRLRMDDYWPENGLVNPSTGQKVSERLRFRMRLRYGAVWEATDWATLGVRIGSGDERSSGGDGNPNSNNQTFTHFFSKKPLFLDAAYVTLQPPGADWVSLTGGKMNKLLWEPALNSPTIYDPDLTPEGAVLQLNYKFGDKQQFQAIGNLAGYVLDESSSSTADAYMFDGQAGLTACLLGDPKAPVLRATALGGYYTTMNLGNTNINISDGSGNRGNSVKVLNGNNQYWLANYNVAYGRGEVTWQLSDQPFLGTPSMLTIGGEYDKNLNSAFNSSALIDPGQTTAWTLQAAFGHAARKGQWQVAYQYKHMEADASLDSITDDDFGGTDRKGHIIKAAYNIRDWWQVGMTMFIGEKISNRPNADAHVQQGINGENAYRLFVDTMFKF